MSCRKQVEPLIECGAGDLRPEYGVLSAREVDRVMMSHVWEVICSHDLPRLANYHVTLVVQ